MSKRVLIVDDSPFIRLIIKKAVLSLGCEVVGEAGDGQNALKLAFNLQPDIITLDNVLPDMMGEDILEEINSEGLKVDVIIISAVGQEAMQEKEKEMGAKGYIVKPFKEDAVIAEVKKLL